MIDINEIITLAEWKAKTMEPDNSAPLITHDITIPPCNGLSDCPLHGSVQADLKNL